MKKKILIAVLCVVMMAFGGLATWAYFTDNDKATNTFTVGKVDILLDEAAVDEKGLAIEDAERVQKNSYHLLPGHDYDKDPTVTVLANSEKCYVRMTVTINNQPQLDAAFVEIGGVDLTTFLTGYDSSKWPKVSEVENADNTRTYTFEYFKPVAKADENTVLEPLFTKVSIPGVVTKVVNGKTKTLNLDNAQMAAFDGLTIDVKAYAMQADGFADKDAAWAKFAEIK